MEEKVRLVVTGRQKDETGEEAVTELRAEARLFERNGSIYILYEELQEGTAIRNTLKLKGSILEMTKEGAVRTRMTFQPGKEYMTEYATPYGCLQMGVRTETVEVLRESGTLRVRAVYTLTSGGYPVSDCELILEAEPVFSQEIVTVQTGH